VSLPPTLESSSRRERGSFDELLTSPAFIESPYATYRRLQEEAPVYWCEAWNTWVLTRHHDITEVLRVPRTFSNTGRFAAFLDLLPLEALTPEVEALRHHYSAGMIQADPPDHTRLRRLVQQAFTPKTVAGLEPFIRSTVDELLQNMEAAHDPDVVEHLAYPLPVIVVAEMLGTPKVDHGSLVRWSRDINGLQASGSPSPESAQLAAESMIEIEQYFRSVIDEHRSAPKDDVIGRMVAAQDTDEEALTDDEMVNMCVTFLIAGHETTKLLIGSGVVTLLQHREQLRDMLSSSAAAAATIEELLRYEAPIQRGWRRTATATSIGSTPIDVDELVFLMLGAGNRDPDFIERPDEFDITRANGKHLAFGAGVHFCIGAPLARLEAPIALTSLFARFPNLSVLEPSWTSSIHFRGPSRLPAVLG
jgi:cytochrome P450